MTTPLLIGIAVIIGAVVVHASAFAIFAKMVQGMITWGYAGTRFSHNVITMTAVVMILLIAHFVQIIMWAVVFLLCGEFQTLAAAVYHSAVNYTTLGYGDIVMTERWRILGPLEATNGVLMFGLSTAAMFTAANRLIEMRLKRR